MSALLCVMQEVYFLGWPRLSFATMNPISYRIQHPLLFQVSGTRFQRHYYRVLEGVFETADISLLDSSTGGIAAETTTKWTLCFWKFDRDTDLAKNGQSHFWKMDNGHWPFQWNMDNGQWTPPLPGPLLLCMTGSHCQEEKIRFSQQTIISWRHWGGPGPMQQLCWRCWLQHETMLLPEYSRRNLSQQTSTFHLRCFHSRYYRFAWVQYSTLY